MNRIYNLIWSNTKERWIVVSERVKGNGKVPQSRLLSFAAIAAMLSAGGPAYALDPGALPSGGKITTGSGTIATSGTQMTVNQSSQQLIANWNSFNIGSNAAVRFNQPNTAASALNRITDQNPTQILGSLSSNGQVYLLNPSGIIFGKTAQVNVGTLVATSLTMLDSDFINGKNKFTTTSTAGTIQNQGTINASNGGVVALIAPKVINEGSITANSGSSLLAAGRQVSLDFTGDGLISYTVDQGAVDAQVANKGLIKADGGVVVMTSKAADALRTATVSNTGIIEARTLQNKAGRILLLSDMQNGNTSVAGTLDASALKGGNGGFIETSGAQVKIADGTKVTTLAPKGKSGTWLLDPTDFTISSGSAAQTTSGIGATTLSMALGSNNVTITTSPTATGTNKGDIKVNAAVSWSANTLTLSALNNIYINANLNGSGTATLALNYGQGALAAGNTSTYTLASGAQVNLPAGQHFSTKQGSDGTSKSYTVITSLGTVADATTGSGQTLQGMARGGNLNGYFVLGSNIDATATAKWNSDGKITPTYAGFTPIGSEFNGFSGGPFAGSFDGLGHTITGLTINRPYTYNVGLFGNIVAATISNIGVIGGSVKGNKYVGGLVGYNNYGGAIINSYATGSVNGTSYVGGLVGDNEADGTIINSYARGNVTGTSFVGGLVGFNWHTSITNSYATGIVKGSSFDVGGLVGYNNYGNISNSYATGSVTGSGYSVGGLVGQNYYGNITNSYAGGSVTGSGYRVGGLVGENLINNGAGSITNSYATGSVTGNEIVGGLVGNNNSNNGAGSITNSYATGSVTGTSHVGGLVGQNQSNNGDNTIANSYATGGVTGSNNVGGLVGYNYGSITHSYATGSVTASGCWVGGLIGVNLINNGVGSITNSYATGILKGTSCVGGLVGQNQLNNGVGSITNSYAKGNVTGSGEHVGGLVGQNQLNNGVGSITNSYATGNVTGSGAHVGGLVGQNQLNNNGVGSITNSYATGSVIGNESVGGLVGQNMCGITNSYATGSVTGNGFYVGGLVGNNDSSTIASSYAKGNIISNNGYGVGGLVGINHGNNVGSITNSYATGSVTGSYIVGGLLGDVGGLVGINNGNNGSGSITNSYATGTVTGSYNVGGLVGINYCVNRGGSITNSYATGSVTGMNNVGGLAGQNMCSITNSYATGNVTGSNYIAGLVGGNNGGITNSYATGSVIGSYIVGGLVGDNNKGGASITNSYAMGKVTGTNNVGGLVGVNDHGTITNSFWNTTTSGQAASDGGTGKTTAQMMQLSTFSSWNTATPKTIANTGGSGAVWRIYEGHTAPLLTCFLTPVTLTDAPDVTTTYNGKSQSAHATTKTALVSGSAATGTNAGFYNGYYSNQQGYDIIGGNLIITTKALTMSGLSVAASKVYDGTTKAVVTDIKALAAAEAVGTGTATDGKSYTGDNVSLTGTAVGIYNNKDVATASTVTYSGLSLTGSQAGNYTLTIQSPVSAKITKKTVTLSASKTNDGKTTLGVGTVTIETGVTVNGITELLGYSGATAYSMNIADNAFNYIKTITLLNGTGGLASNYALPTLNHGNAPVAIH